MKIVVLAGGLSTERDVSLSSGRGIYRALKENGHQVILLDVFLGLPDAWSQYPPETLFDQDVDWAASIQGVAEKAPDLDQIRALRPDFRTLLGPGVLTLCQISDMVFLGLHGANGEDGRIQALFDLMGIRYTGTGHTSSALCMNKHITKQMFRGTGIPAPPSITVKKGESFELPEEIGFPCMVKTCCGGSSVGVYRVEDVFGLERALRMRSPWKTRCSSSAASSDGNFPSQSWREKRFRSSRSLPSADSTIIKTNIRQEVP